MLAIGSSLKIVMTYTAGSSLPMMLSLSTFCTFVFAEE